MIHFSKLTPSAQDWLDRVARGGYPIPYGSAPKELKWHGLIRKNPLTGTLSLTTDGIRCWQNRNSPETDTETDEDSRSGFSPRTYTLFGVLLIGLSLLAAIL